MAEDIRTMKDTSDVKEFQVKYELPDCVVLDSGYCSMGRMIAYEACKRSGYTYYDAVMLLELVPQYGLSKDQVDVYERKLRRRAYSAEELLAFNQSCSIVFLDIEGSMEYRYEKERIILEIFLEAYE